MKFKIITALSILVSFAFLTSVFTVGIVTYYKDRDKALSTKVEGDGNADGLFEITTLTAAEVKKHSTAEDCWLIIENNVYNVTGFLNSHPGGAFLVAKYCGSDASAPFNSRDRNPPELHSGFARDLLRSYYIGPLGQKPENLIFPDTTSQNNLLNLPTVPASQNAGATAGLVIDLTEVARHATVQNCWIVVSAKVYDVTGFISQHPGGVSQITGWCGKEATNAFQTRGGGNKDHSQTAYAMLSSYLIGSVGQSVSITSGGVSPTPALSSGGSCVNLPAAICSKYPESTRIEGGYEDEGKWEGKVSTQNGCRAIKVGSGGTITSDKPC